jgi:2-dehydropantoate 2-reductase
MNICFFGVGGVGGYFGALVTKKFKDIHTIYFIARGQHKDAICSNGLILKKAGSNEIISVIPEICTDSVDRLPICEIIVLSVKAYDLENATKEIAKITDKNTIVLPLLNGVDIYQRIRKNLTTGVILPSCVYVATYIESPGIIFQNGGNGKIFMGDDPSRPGYSLQPLFTILAGSGIDFKLEENVSISIWSKYMFIAAYGLVTATFGKTLGEVLENAELSRIIKTIMQEIKLVADRLNILLDHDIVEISFQKARQFPSDAKTSFQRDVESKGKMNEGDLFGGTLIRYGLELGVPIPNTESIYKKLLNKFD